MATTRPSIWATAAPAAGSASSFARSPAEFACCAVSWSRPVVVNRGFRPETAAAAAGPARDRLIAALVQTAHRHRFYGLQLDFEGLHETDRQAYAEFTERLATALHRRGMQLSVAVPAPLAAPGPSPSPAGG